MVCQRRETGDEPGASAGNEETALWLQRRARELGFSPGEAVSALEVHDDLLRIDSRIDEIEGLLEERDDPQSEGADTTEMNDV